MIKFENLFNLFVPNFVEANDMPATTEELMKKYNLKLMHVRRLDGRTVTVAYRCTGSIIEIASTICHPRDTFIRKVGSNRAVTNFAAGISIHVPRPREGAVAEFVRHIFSAEKNND